MAVSDVRFHDKPNQPGTALSFPKQTFGKRQPVNKAFQQSWFKTWSWLHYDEATDASFCYYCRKAVQEGKLKATNKDLAFITPPRKFLKIWCSEIDSGGIFTKRLR